MRQRGRNPAVFGAALRCALAYGAPPTAVTGSAPAHAENPPPQR